jgi:hypothetical protein
MFEHASPSGRVPADTTDSTAELTSSPGMADSRQQQVLRYLARFEYPVELRTIAAAVVAEEQCVPVEAVSDDERERVTIKLHHIDMPKLVADGIVAYDSESRMAVFTGTADVTGRFADDSGYLSDAV